MINKRKGKGYPGKIVFLTLFLCAILGCSNEESGNDSSDLQGDIDSYLKEARLSHNIPGLALAVVEGDQVIFEDYYGSASLEESIAIDSNTMFRVFSATKLITTTGVFQLIQDGKLKLNDPISKFLDDLPVKWRNVHIANLLSHSSGLPDMIRYPSTLSDDDLMKKLAVEEIEFKPGYKHSYNQTNYWLLAKIIEEVSQTSFSEFILLNQFNELDKGVLFSSNSVPDIPNRATRYHYSSNEKRHKKDTRNDGSRGHAGNGLNISLKTFISWDIRLKNDILLSGSTKNKMWRPFPFSGKFKYQDDDFLHGWGYYSVGNLASYGFTGGNLAAYRHFPQCNISIIFLSNGYEFPVYDIVVNDIARMVLPKLKGLDLVQERDIVELVMSRDLTAALKAFSKLKTENPKSKFDNLRWNINNIGNEYSWNDDPDRALEVYRLNLEAFPNWWISAATLAEFYDQNSDTVNAIKYYERAVTLNEKNEYKYNDGMSTRIWGLSKSVNSN